MMERREDGPDTTNQDTTDRALAGGLTGWLLDRLRSTRRPRPRLALLERIALAPRQPFSEAHAIRHGHHRGARMERRIVGAE